MPATEPALPTIPDSGNLFSSTGAHNGGRKGVGRKKGAGNRQATNEAVVEEFVGQLRQFRALQQELAPWTEAFRAQHGRKPRLEDVERTRTCLAVPNLSRSCSPLHMDSGQL